MHPFNIVCHSLCWFDLKMYELISRIFELISGNWSLILRDDPIHGPKLTVLLLLSQFIGGILHIFHCSACIMQEFAICCTLLLANHRFRQPIESGTHIFNKPFNITVLSYGRFTNQVFECQTFWLVKSLQGYPPCEMIPRLWLINCTY